MIRLSYLWNVAYQNLAPTIPRDQEEESLSFFLMVRDQEEESLSFFLMVFQRDDVQGQKKDISGL